MSFHFNKLEFPSPKIALFKVWLKLAHMFLRRFLIFLNVFSQFHNYLAFKKGVVLHLNKREFPSPKITLCIVWLKLAHWYWGGRFLIYQYIFANFRIYLP